MFYSPRHAPSEPTATTSLHSSMSHSECKYGPQLVLGDCTSDFCMRISFWSVRTNGPPGAEYCSIVQRLPYPSNRNQLLLRSRNSQCRSTYQPTDKTHVLSAPHRRGSLTWDPALCAIKNKNTSSNAYPHGLTRQGVLRPPVNPYSNRKRLDCAYGIATVTVPSGRPLARLPITTTKKEQFIIAMVCNYWNHSWLAFSSVVTRHMKFKKYFIRLNLTFIFIIIIIQWFRILL